MLNLKRIGDNIMYAIPKSFIRRYKNILSPDGDKLGFSDYAGLGATVASIGATTINPYEDINGSQDFGSRMDTNKAGWQGALSMGAQGAAAGSMFGPVGTIVGGLGGAAIGAIQAKKTARMFNAEQVAFERDVERNEYEYDKANLYAFDQGRGRMSMYSPFGKELGGEYSVPLNNSQFLAEGATKVVNAGTHEQGGNVPVTDNQGMVDTYVEGGEVVVDDMVFSQRLGYAPIAEQLSKQKGQLEDIMNKSSDPTERNTLDRELMKIDKEIRKLFNEQQSVAQQLAMQEQAQQQMMMQDQPQGQHMMEDGTMMNDSEMSGYANTNPF